MFLRYKLKMETYHIKRTTLREAFEMIEWVNNYDNTFEKTRWHMFFVLLLDCLCSFKTKNIQSSVNKFNNKLKKLFDDKSKNIEAEKIDLKDVEVL